MLQIAMIMVLLLSISCWSKRMLNKRMRERRESMAESMAGKASLGSAGGLPPVPAQLPSAAQRTDPEASAAV